MSSKKQVDILITGTSGVGKSTLINGLVGKRVAKTGNQLLLVESENLTSYTVNVKDVTAEESDGGIEAVVWDSPGLLDSAGGENEYLTELKEKCVNADIIIYCIDISATRSSGLTEAEIAQSDLHAMSKLTTTFGLEWWKRSIFVMTRANVLEAALKVKPDPEKRFNDKLKEWKERIVATLTATGVPKEVAYEIPVQPAGHPKKPRLPGRDNWIRALWHIIVSSRTLPSNSERIVLHQEEDNFIQQRRISTSEQGWRTRAPINPTSADSIEAVDLVMGPIYPKTDKVTPIESQQGPYEGTPNIVAPVKQQKPEVTYKVGREMRHSFPPREREPLHENVQEAQPVTPHSQEATREDRERIVRDQDRDATYEKGRKTVPIGLQGHAEATCQDGQGVRAPNEPVARESNYEAVREMPDSAGLIRQEYCETRNGEDQEILAFINSQGHEANNKEGEGKLMPIKPKAVHEEPTFTPVVPTSMTKSSKGRVDVLITGTSGVGKSTLINGLVGKRVAKTGNQLFVESKSITSYTVNVKDVTAEESDGGIEAVVWDSPGLLDSAGGENEYLTELKKKCVNADIIIYCIDISATRSSGLTDAEIAQSDLHAMSKLTTTFGSEWWKRSIFVMTRANVLEAALKVKPDPEKRFNDKLKEWKERIVATLTATGVPKEVACEIPVQPAGHPKKPRLPGRDNWIIALWRIIVSFTTLPSNAEQENNFVHQRHVPTPAECQKTRADPASDAIEAIEQIVASMNQTSDSETSIDSHPKSPHFVGNKQSREMTHKEDRGMPHLAEPIDQRGQKSVYGESRGTLTDNPQSNKTIREQDNNIIKESTFKEGQPAPDSEARVNSMFKNDRETSDSVASDSTSPNKPQSHLSTAGSETTTDPKVPATNQQGHLPTAAAKEPAGDGIEGVSWRAVHFADTVVYLKAVKKVQRAAPNRTTSDSVAPINPSREERQGTANSLIKPQYRESASEGDRPTAAGSGTTAGAVDSRAGATVERISWRTVRLGDTVVYLKVYPKQYLRETQV